MDEDERSLVNRDNISFYFNGSGLYISFYFKVE